MTWVYVGLLFVLIGLPLRALAESNDAGSTTVPSPADAAPSPASNSSVSLSPATSAVASATPIRRGLPAPIDPKDNVFPSNDYPGPTIGAPNDNTVYPLQKALFGDKPFDNGFRIYGWLNPGISFSSSKYSNYPQSYTVVPDEPEIDQFVLRLEKLPDTVQTDHVDWGFRISNLYGIDYRFTTAQGYFSNQLLERNQTYGYDPVELFADIYFPKFGQGTTLQIGRYI